MSIKSDKWIIDKCINENLIEPFESKQITKDINDNKVISYGLSSYGYDVKCSKEFKIFTNINSTIIDPKNFDERSFIDVETDVCIIPPNSFVLARTIEKFNMPKNVVGMCLSKSTYARCSILVNATLLQPEWSGHLVLEFSNTSNLPAKLYANEGAATVVFFESDEFCNLTYKDLKGVYQDQVGIKLPTVK